MEAERHMLSFLGPELLDELLAVSIIKEIPDKTEILKELQYVKVVPIVLEGLVKVYSRFNDKELLLYYIEPAQSCVMTFYAALQNTPSKVFAVTEADSKILLIPSEKLPQWVKGYPKFNELFYNQFNIRYTEMLETIGHLLLDKMDKRLFDHLAKKIEVSHHDSIKMSHNQLANELGTAREVVTRVLKKLENEGKVVQNEDGIKIIGEW